MIRIDQRDLNAYCAGHLAGEEEDPRIAAYPATFFTEALALGASYSQSSQGCITPHYRYTHPADLFDLPQLAEASLIREVLEAIQKKDPGKTGLLKVNGPYSVLASLVEPKGFFRWLKHEPRAVHQGLESIGAGIGAYIHRAFTLGVQILSLADPYANLGILGEGHYRVFAAEPLIRLVQHVLKERAASGRIIHLCPHTSLPLEQLGLVKSESILVAEPPRPYTLLLSDGAAQDLALVGHRCIYAKAARELIALTIA